MIFTCKSALISRNIELFWSSAVILQRWSLWSPFVPICIWRNVMHMICVGDILQIVRHFVSRWDGLGECVWVLKIWNRTLESRSPFPSILQMDGIRILEKQFQGSHGCTNRILKNILKKIIFVVRNQIFQGPLQCSKNSNVTTGSGIAYQRAHALSEEKRRSWWRYIWTFCQSAVPWRCSPRIRPGSRFQPEHTKLSDTWPHGQAGQAGRERNVGP